MLLPLFPRLMLPGTSRCPSSWFMGTIPCPFDDITQAFTLQGQRQPWCYCNHQTVLDHGIMTLTSLFPQASQRNKNHQEHELLSHRDPVMVIIVVGAVVTTIIFSLQLVFRISLDYTNASIQDVMGNHYPLSKS